MDDPAGVPLKDSPRLCPQCRSEVSGELASGVKFCRACGAGLNAPEPRTGVSAFPKRSTLWLCFWLFFVGGPLLAFAAPFTERLLAPLLGYVGFNQGQMAFVTIGVGALGAGFSLARLITKTRAGFFIAGALLSLGVVVVYGAVLFIGCMVEMKRIHF
jgi:hypothetical protein